MVGAASVTAVARGGWKLVLVVVGPTDSSVIDE